MSSFWHAFFLMLIFIPLIFVWGFALVDIFVRDDMSGALKALWVFVIIVVPFFGTLVYLLLRPSRSRGDARLAPPAPTAAAPPPASGSASDSTLDQLGKLSDLHDRGKVTDEEFAAQKARLLGSSPSSA